MKQGPLGMSNEELIQWVSNHSKMTPGEVRLYLPGIKLYCAQHAISIQAAVEILVVLSNAGIQAAKVGKALRKCLNKLLNEQVLQETQHG